MITDRGPEDYPESPEERRKRQNREHQAKWRAGHPEEARAAQRRKYERHGDKIREAAAERRRTLKGEHGDKEGER